MRGRLRTKDRSYKNVGRSPMSTVSNGEPTRKDTIMKLVYIFTVILALTLAEEQQIKGVENDEVAAPEPSNLEHREEANVVRVTRYVSPSQREPYWETYQPNQGANYWTPEVQNDYYWGSTNAPEKYTTTTTPVPVIKNEMYIGDNGDYKYEYQIADGTSVGEQGYYTDPSQNEESLVKKGWYSFLGADGVTYTVTYWADHTGYHAYGSHLPGGAAGNVVNSQQQGTNYPVQTSAPTTQRPFSPSKPTYPTNKPPQGTYNPPQQTYKPPQQTYNPPQQTYNPPQQTYNSPQQTYNPPQQTYNPPQSTYNPPQQTSTQSQQQPSYYPAQQPNYNSAQQPTYNQPPQQIYYPNYSV